MPLTWFAHQVPVLGLKMNRPRWIDATAMCVGSMMPDLMYSFSSLVHIDTHERPAFTWGLPLTVVTAFVERFVLAPVVPLLLSDLGGFRLHSYAVLARRRPAVVATILCGAVGIASHVVMDWFTHPGRPGVRWLGYDDVAVTAFGMTEPLAGVFQLLGHSVGTALGVWLLWSIGSRRLLEVWYGPAEVSQARAGSPPAVGRVIVGTTTCIGSLGGLVWSVLEGGRMQLVERPFVGALLGAVAGSAVVLPATRRREPIPPASSDRDSADRIGSSA
ncbi:hypothetical protein BH24ACT5_BH24ACT5_06720 [soil metagenome]